MILNARHLKRTLASYFAYYHGSRPIWASTSNVHFLGESRVWEGSSRSRNSAACMRRSDILADAFLANHKGCIEATSEEDAESREKEIEHESDL